MKIKILHLVEGAEKARGLAVIIDVFRAFSLAAYAFGAGAEKIIPVGDIETARLLKEKNPEYLLVGERNERKVPGFDFGNSPTQILKADLTGKSIIHTTSAGTKGLVSAVHAGEIITGSFVNSPAIVRYIKSRKPEIVSLVCMGYAASHPVEEDTLCAEHISNELKGKKNNFEEMKSVIRHSSGKRFFEPGKQSFAPSSDFDLCMNINHFQFVLKAEKHGDFFELKKIAVV